MKLDTTEPLKPESNVWENGLTQPTNPPSKTKVEKGKSSQVKDSTEDQRTAIVARISKAKSGTQSAQIQQAKDYADAVTDSVAALAVPLIGLNIIEKGINSLASGGNVATSFLHSMPVTGITINANSISMIGMDDPLELESIDDPLIAALMLTGV